ncbi:hypothetical protein AB0F96_02425 [Streptomyces sp. NPDC023998]|uniref:hypothetical protein n=1 Tax=Streptomyces sp. NPDC023998 TaxID=3154597 RepID=UPI0033EC791E
MVVPSLTPAAPHGIWQSAGEASALWALASVGPDALAEELRGTADQVKEEAQASG